MTTFETYLAEKWSTNAELPDATDKLYGYYVWLDENINDIATSYASLCVEEARKEMIAIAEEVHRKCVTDPNYEEGSNCDSNYRRGIEAVLYLLQPNQSQKQEPKQ